MTRAAYQSIFDAAQTRIASLEEERCKEIEMAQTRALRFPGSRPPMLRELLRRMKDEPPSEDWRERCSHTLRRLHVALLRENAPTETYRIAANAYVDGQTAVAARWLDANTLLRPWGVK